MPRSTALVLLSLLPFALAEAQPKKLTIEAIYGGDLSSPAPSQIRWTPEGHLSYFLSTDDGRDLWLFDRGTFERRVLVSTDWFRRIRFSATRYSFRRSSSSSTDPEI